MIVEGKRIVSSSDDAKFLCRVTIVNLMLGGMKAKALAEACGETDQPLLSWIKAVDEHGFESLLGLNSLGDLTDFQLFLIPMYFSLQLHYTIN